MPSNNLTMPSNGLFFFILGLVVASVTANTTATVTEVFTPSEEFGSDTNNVTTVTPLNTTTAGITTASNTIIITTKSTMNSTKANSTIPSLTTSQEGSETPGKDAKSPMLITTPKPIDPSKSTTAKNKGTTPKPKTASDNTGIIILVVIILVAVGFGVACFLARRRGRRYSVDFTSRPDETNIPLSAVEPELPIDSVPQNGLQTFEPAETSTKEPQEPEAKPEVQEEQKAEADKSVVDPSAESAAPAPSPDSSEDKPKEDVVEQSPPAPVEPTVEDKTDDEGTVSNKTSVESLKETNENNSNNADYCQKRDLKKSNVFWDVPLDCPV